MKMFVFFTALLFSCANWATQWAKYPIELSSNDGVNVTIVPNSDKNKALIQVNGVNHDIDGVVFLTSLQPHGSNKAYKYTYDGSLRALINVDQGYRCCAYTLYIPNSNQSIYLTKNAQSNPAIVEDLNAQYQQQLTTGVQQKLAQFNRPKHLQQQQQVVTKATQHLQQQCGYNVATQVDWTTISDADLNQYSIGAFCAQVANEMANQCNTEPRFKAHVASYNTIHCEFTEQLKLRTEGNVLHFKTSPKAANQREFIAAFLRNL